MRSSVLSLCVLVLTACVLTSCERQPQDTSAISPRPRLGKAAKAAVPVQPDFELPAEYQVSITPAVEAYKLP